jgi:1-acyl-sn-glycerol-3-phosphate acyltransferase
MRSGAPLLPAGIAGTDRIFPGGSNVPHASRISIRVGEPFTLPHVPDGRIDRAALAAGTELIMASISELLPDSQRPI